MDTQGVYLPMVSSLEIGSYVLDLRFDVSFVSGFLDEISKFVYQIDGVRNTKLR